MENNGFVKVETPVAKPPVFARVFAIISLVLGILCLCYQAFAILISSLLGLFSAYLDSSGTDGIAFSFIFTWFCFIISFVVLIFAIVGLILGCIAKKRGKPSCSKAGVVLNVIAVILSLLALVVAVVLFYINLQNGSFTDFFASQF